MSNPTVTTEVAADPSVGRRERKKQATREALHQATLDLVEERGLAGVTVEDITERADVSVRTFFNHFSSKEEAVLERDPERTARLCAAIATRPAGETPLTALREAMLSDAFLRVLSPEQMRRRMRLIRSEPTLQAIMKAHFDEMLTEVGAVIGQRTGTDPIADLYPTLVASTAFAACHTAMLRWCETGGPQEIGDVITQAFDQLAGGLVPPAPHAEEVLS